MNLYLIAFIPPEPLRSQIEGLKEEMRDRFGASRALRSPAHITLQPPFKRPANIEQTLVSALQKLAAVQTPFEVVLDGFDSFPPRVIFVKVANHLPLRQLHEDLKILLKEYLGFTASQLRYNMHPHITIAYRDLTPLNFEEAWPEFSGRAFSSKFIVKSIFLLKHNGKFWNIYKEFLFHNQNNYLS